MKILVLDEFGHDGPYIGRYHGTYNEGPIFGLAGLIIDAQHARPFSDEFLAMKKDVPNIKEIIKRAKREKIANYKKRHGTTKGCSLKNLDEITVEVKGNSVFQVDSFLPHRNYKAREGTKRFGERLFGKLDAFGAKIVYFGLEKYMPRRGFDAKALHLNVLWQSVSIAYQYAKRVNDNFAILLDQHSVHYDRAMRVLNEIARGPDHKLLLAEPPFQAISDCSHLVQAADWIGSMVGRVHTYQTQPTEWPELSSYPKLFEGEIKRRSLPGCRLQAKPASHGGASLAVS